MADVMSRRVNLIPMAGAGQRFVDAGYTLPKPLIPIDGLPMVVRAASALPPADHWVFVCRAEHVRDSAIDHELRRHFSPVTIVSTDALTAGQASSCLLAASALRPDDRLTIGACDNSMRFDAGALDRMWDAGCDAVVWTFRDNPVVLTDPAMYGWVATTASGRVTGVSCKVPISATPMRDHAVVGAFAFRRAADFLAVTRRTIELDRRIRGEFYLDVVMDQAVVDGLDVRVLEVQRYVCWGTPQDLEQATGGRP